MIKLTQEIELNAEVKGDKIICFDLNTVNLLLGTSAAGSNIGIYACKKIKAKEWEIPIASIEKRITEIESRIQTYEYRLKFMKQVVQDNKRKDEIKKKGR